MGTLGLQTWSLHRNLGPLRLSKWNEGRGISVEPEPQPQTLTLLELPARVRQLGILQVELCQFYLPSTEPEYLAALRAAFDQAGVQIASFLLDYGDISSENPARRAADMDWAKTWIGYAAQVGAKRVRITAGLAAAQDTAALGRAVESLTELAAHANAAGVRLLIENFRPLASTAANISRLLTALDGRVGLTVDYGNVKGPNRFDELQAMMPWAETIHAKCDCDANGALYEESFLRCMELADQAGFAGPYSIVYEGPGDQWEGISKVKALIEPYVRAAA